VVSVLKDLIRRKSESESGLKIVEAANRENVKPDGATR
jgi:hypothetical protein